LSRFRDLAGSSSFAPIKGRPAVSVSLRPSHEKRVPIGLADIIRHPDIGVVDVLRAADNVAGT
jgi:hypothetical protein